jgi:hypothetical protein
MPGAQGPEPQDRGSGQRSRAPGDLFQTCRKTKDGGKGVAGMKTSISMLPDLPPLKREGNIIYFPGGAWPQEAPEPPKEPPIPCYDEHCESFSGVDFGGNHARILGAFYYLRIHSLEELAGTPVSKLKLHYRIGRKSLEIIHAALKSRGFALGDDWRSIAGAKRHEGRRPEGSKTDGPEAVPGWPYIP